MFYFNAHLRMHSIPPMKYFHVPFTIYSRKVGIPLSPLEGVIGNCKKKKHRETCRNTKNTACAQRALRATHQHATLTAN
eukprot:scaffold10954_cov267-Chaetoceros_neogracile.AAC.7